MGQFRVTSGTDLAVKFLLMFAAIGIISAIAAAIDPVVKYVLSDIGKDIDAVTFCVATALFFIFLAMIPGDADVHMGTISTFVYVLEVHKIFLTW